MPLLNEAAHSCLMRASAEYHHRPGTRIVVKGSSADRVAIARGYLLRLGETPATNVLASTSRGDPHTVTVSLLLAALPHRKSVAPAIDPIKDRMNELDQLQAKNRNDIRDIDARATAGIKRAIDSAAQADEHADAAQSRTYQANRTAGQSSSQTADVSVPLPPPPSAALPTRPGTDEPTTPPHAAQPPTVHPPVSQRPVPPARVPHAGSNPTTPAAAADPYIVGSQIRQWKDRLQSGGIEFNNPQIMVVGVDTGVAVYIHGYADTTHSALPGVQQQGVVKVSDYMRVDLDAPFTPGEFAITPGQGAIQPVPIDGVATWEFKVKPLTATAEPQTLVIHPYLIPPDSLSMQPLPERNFMVAVTVESFWHHIVLLWEEDPIKVLKYLLPGGKGWSGLGAFLTGLIALLTSLGVIAWIRRKINPHEAAPKDGKT